MRKLMAVTLMALTLGLTGCTMAHRTTSYYKNGVLDRVVQSDTPFLYNKGVNLSSELVGLEFNMVDPNTGNPAPSASINYGDASVRTIPLTSGTDDIQEIFGTYQETLSWDKSMWGAEVASVKYNLSAGGIGILAIGQSSKAERIKTLLDRIADLKAATDKTKTETPDTK